VEIAAEIGEMYLEAKERQGLQQPAEASIEQILEGANPY
jgi:hypothetical protein